MLFSKLWESWFDEYKIAFSSIIAKCFESLNRMNNSIRMLINEYINMIELYGTSNKELISLYHEYANIKTLFDASVVMYRKENSDKIVSIFLKVLEIKGWDWDSQRDTQYITSKKSKFKEIK